MYQGVNRRPFTAKAQVQFQDSGICDGQRDTEAGFSGNASVFSHSIIPPVSHMHSSVTSVE